MIYLKHTLELIPLLHQYLVSATNPLLKAIDEVHVCRNMSVQTHAWKFHYLAVNGLHTYMYMCAKCHVHVCYMYMYM